MIVPIFNPAGAAYRANPYPTLAHLRAENPVHWSPHVKAWVLTRHTDVQNALRSDTMSVDKITPFYKALPSARQAELETLVRYLGRWMTFRDPPDHGRLRRLVARAFTPKSMAAIQPNVEAVTAHLLDQLHGRDSCDLAADFANLLPAYVILDMLGVPRAMLPDMKAWSDEIGLFIGTSQVTPDRNQRAQAGVIGMAAAFRRLIAEHRANPRPDMLMTLIEANDAGDGRLDDDELIATAILFLFAGHETSASLLAMSSLALMQDNDRRRAFQALEDPRAIATAVEEFLRYDGPTPAMMRIAMIDHEHRWPHHQGQRPHRHFARCRQPRPRCIHRTRRPRLHPPPQPARHLRLRPALLPWRTPRPHGSADRPPGPPPPLSRDAPRHA